MPLDDTLSYQTCANCGLETGFEEMRAQATLGGTSLLRCGPPGSQGQLSDVNQTVESHQPLPAHQQLSSGLELRRKVRTLLESPRLNAADNFCAVSSSRAPKQGTNIAAQTNRASKWSVPVRVTRIMPPAPGIPPGPSAGVDHGLAQNTMRNLSDFQMWESRRNCPRQMLSTVRYR